jgi:Zn-dependent protease with chaperone function
VTIAPRLRAPREIALFRLGVAFSALVWILLTVTIHGLVLAAAVMLLVLVGRAFRLAQIAGDGVRVKERQLPALSARIRRGCDMLGLRETIDVYLVESNELRASTIRLGWRHTVVLHSSLVAACGDSPLLDFVIGREIGRIASGQTWWEGFLAPYRLLPWIGTTYRRACEYTCDRCGLHVAGALDPALRALAVLTAGAKQAPKIDLAVVEEQRVEANAAWVFVCELLSPAPYLCNRVAALRACQPGAPAAREILPPQLVYILGAAQVVATASALGFWIASGGPVAIGGPVAHEFFRPYTSFLASTGAVFRGRTPSCGTLDPGKVYLAGRLSLWAGHPIGALAELEPGTRWCGAIIPIGGTILRDGTLAYRTHDPDGYALFTEDSVRRVGEHWVRDEHPEDNDTRIAVIQCPNGRPSDMHLWPDRSGYAYRCPPDKRIFRESGEVLGKSGRVLALGYDQTWLGTELENHFGFGPSLINAEGVEWDIPMSAFSAVGLPEILAVRSQPDGFLVAVSLTIETGKPDSVTKAFHIGLYAKVTEVGTYAPDIRGRAPRGVVLDAEGALYSILSLQGDDIVQRAPLLPGTATVVYRANEHPVKINDAGGSAWLVTGL